MASSRTGSCWLPARLPVAAARRGGSDTPAKSGAPGRHHINFMVSEIDDIGRAQHRMARGGVPVVFGPGRHPISGSVFIDFLDPDGLTLEYSFGMETFDAANVRAPRGWPAKPESADAWGAPRRRATGSLGALLSTPVGDAGNG